MSTYARILAFIFSLSLVVSACKRDNEDVVAPPPVAAAANYKDSAVAYSRDIYLWYKQIPASFNGSGYPDLNAIMTALRQYSVEPGFSVPVDRWSFAVEKSEWDNLSAGIGGDFGLGVFFRAPDDLRVKSVQPLSPAGRAGVQRGWRIEKIAGSANITTSNTAFISNQVFNSTSTAFTFRKPDNTTVDITLTAGSYANRAVLKDTVFNQGGIKTGYFVFDSFLGDTASIYNDFSRIFGSFAASGVRDVVIDLRYNGGGYVSVAEKLANYLVPPSANTKVMMKQQYNDKYSTYNSLARFAKIGSFAPQNIYFIVSGATASASELLINSLRPHTSVVVLGPSKTYGKPVGYFPIPLGNNYIFPVSFRTVNSLDEGSYFNGIVLNHTVADGLDQPWGSLTESALAAALKHSSTGSFARGMNNEIYQESSETKNANRNIDPSFKGAIDRAPW